MREIDPNLQAHLDAGATTLTRIWKVYRRDGVVMAFSDHDRDLDFDGDLCLAASALNASAFQTSLGLGTDNSEAMGALSHASVTSEDIMAGLYDGAEIRQWLVNWEDTRQYLLQFVGSFGEIREIDGAFEVDIRGATEPLNHPVGRSYTRQCQHVLGDAACGVDLADPAYQATGTVAEVIDGNQIVVTLAHAHDAYWFEGGAINWAGSNRISFVTEDRPHALGRQILLRETMSPVPSVGDVFTITVGCTRRATVCKNKFGNLINFGGFPFIPGEDRSGAYPKAAAKLDGGSLFGGLPDE